MIKRVSLFLLILCAVSYSRADEISYRWRIPKSVSKRNLLHRARFLWQDDGFHFKKDQTSFFEADSLHILALMVEFQPDNNANTTGDGRFDMTLPTEPVIDPPPHDRSYFQDQLTALSNYYRTVSSGKLIISFSVTETVLELPNVMAHYNPATDGEATDRGLAELFRDAVAAADSEDIVFSDYDCFLIFHAGVGRDIALDYDPTPSDIPSAFINIDDLREQLGDGDPLYEGISVEDGSFSVQEGIILPETESQEGYEIGLLGTMTLMFGFQLGLPALWNTETGQSGIGKWGLMDQGSGNYYGLIPAQPCAWSRVFLGWEIPVEKRQGIDLMLACPQIADTGSVYKVPINDHEYFLIENRNHDADGDGYARGVDGSGVDVTFRPDGLIESTEAAGVIVSVDDYDYDLPGSGILIWHIDEEVIAQNIAENRINSDKTMRGVDLEEADGAQDIGEAYGLFDAGSGSETGVLHDAWFMDNDIHMLANGSDEVAFTPDSYPNSRSNSGGNSHIVISDFSGIDTTMTFTITTDLLQEGFPVDFGEEGMPFPPLYGDLDGDGELEIIVAVRTGKIYAWKKDGQPVIESDAMGYRISESGDTTNFPVPLYADAGEPFTVSPVVGDLTEDGADEIVGAIESGEIHTWSFQTDSAQKTILFTGESETITALMVTPDEVVFGTQNGRVIGLGYPEEYIWVQDLEEGSVFGLCRFGNESVGSVAVTYSGGMALLNTTGGIEWDANLAAGSEFTPPVSAWLPDGECVAVAMNSTGEGWVVDETGGILFTFSVNSAANATLDLALGDVDSDGVFEFITCADENVWALNHNGSLLNYFPVPQVDRNVLLSPPILGDVDGDEEVDIIVTTSDGNVEAYQKNGDPVMGFPLTFGSSAPISPILCDLDGDGDIELAAVSDRGYLFVWDLEGAYDPVTIPWGSHLHDPAHTGYYPVQLQPGPAGSDAMPSNQVYNYPNPNEENHTTIRYRLEQTADVRITIYSLAGEKIDSFSGPGEPLTENEVVWNLDDVHSGVYFCRVQAEGSGWEKVVTFKIAVVK
ncbi:FG-GAP-like repeat-containing protein [bacterium]